MASAALRSAILSLLRGLPPADGTDDAALLERFVAWMSGVPHLRETIPYPRMLYRIYP